MTPRGGGCWRHHDLVCSQRTRVCTSFILCGMTATCSKDMRRNYGTRTTTTRTIAHDPCPSRDRHPSYTDWVDTRTMTMDRPNQINVVIDIVTKTCVNHYSLCNVVSHHCLTANDHAVHEQLWVFV